jgi:hypothetical protein
VELFGEGPGGFLVSGSEQALQALGERVAVSPIGTVGGEKLAVELTGEASALSLEVSLEELSSAHSGGLKEFFS